MFVACVELKSHRLKVFLNPSSKRREFAHLYRVQCLQRRLLSLKVGKRANNGMSPIQSPQCPVLKSPRNECMPDLPPQEAGNITDDLVTLVYESQ